MPSGRTLRNIFLAFFLSLTLTFVLAFLYIFYPVIWKVSSQLLNSHEGIGSFAFGVSISRYLLFVFLLLESLLFLLIFALLKRRRAAAVPVKSQTV
jgi:uncharacterized BrkB/YihY/UPF0761 family membrane protein